VPEELARTGIQRSDESEFGNKIKDRWPRAGRGRRARLDNRYITVQHGRMAPLSNAERQARWQAKRKALVQAHPDLIEGALVQDAERCEELPSEQRAALADKLGDIAMRHLRRAQELSEMARKVRPPGWNPFPGR
jgi:hypothetical protein